MINFVVIPTILIKKYFFYCWKKSIGPYRVCIYFRFQQICFVFNAEIRGYAFRNNYNSRNVLLFVKLARSWANRRRLQQTLTPVLYYSPVTTKTLQQINKWTLYINYAVADGYGFKYKWNRIRKFYSRVRLPITK